MLVLNTFVTSLSLYLWVFTM